MREHIYRALTDTRGGNEPSEWVYGAVAKFMSISGEIYTAIIPEIDGQNLMCELKRVIPETVCEDTGLEPGQIVSMMNWREEAEAKQRGTHDTRR